MSWEGRDLDSSSIGLDFKKIFGILSCKINEVLALSALCPFPVV